MRMFEKVLFLLLEAVIVHGSHVMMNLSWFVGLGFMYVAGQEEAYEVVRVSFMVIVLLSLIHI